MENQEALKKWENILSKCLGDIFKQHPNLNEVQVAKVLKIPRATFNRIKNERRIPKIDNLLKILVGSGNKDMVMEAISLQSSELAQLVKNSFEVSLQQDDKILTSSELEGILEDRDVFVAYLLAGLPRGTNKIQLVDVLGSSGMEAIKTLENQDIVSNEDGLYRLKRKGSLIRSFNSIKRHINTYSKFYKTAHAGLGKNYIHSLADGLTEEGVRKVREIHKKFHQELQDVYRSENYRGDIPSFSVAFCDTLTSEKEVLQ